MFLSQSVSSLDQKIIETLISPKPKPRLTTFKRYYARSLSTSKERNYSPFRHSKPIDDYLVQKIESLAPTKIERQFSKRRSKSQKIRTQKSELPPGPSLEMQSMIDTLRKKSLKIAQEATLQEWRVKKKANKKPKKPFSFDVRQIRWAEQKWGNGCYQGKYSQKLHPICLIYQDFADKAVINFKSLPDPFEGYEHIQF